MKPKKTAANNMAPRTRETAVPMKDPCRSTRSPTRCVT